MQFLKDKKVFVTGHTGFKGAWFLYLLKEYGADIKGYALPALEPSLFRFGQASRLCEHVEQDIRNKEALEKEILDFQPDFVFHLAAQPLVLDSYKNPVYTYEVNQLGTVYLLEALRSLEKPCVCVIITTDKVYKDQNKQAGYIETDVLGGYDPYSASKAGCELIVDSYRNSFFNPGDYQQHKKSIATARAGNVIGGGDYAENRLIPDIIRAIENNAPIIIRIPDAVRPWQHVLDALNAYIALAEALYNHPDDSFFNGAWNFGPLKNDMWPVLKVAETVVELFGKGEIENQKNKVAPKETSLLMLDVNKSLEKLSWNPIWNAHQAIKKTAEWHQLFNKNPKLINDIIRNQIQEFIHDK